MEGIFFVLDKIGIPNVGLSIILFTIVIYLLLMPLTIKQQKFSKLSAKMNPELQAIQAKYKNRKDNDSMMAMNAESLSFLFLYLACDTVEYGARNVADAFGNNPPDCGGGYGVYQRFKGNQYRQSHAYKADGLQVAVILESGKPHDGSGNGASPDKDKEAPSPNIPGLASQ